MKRLNDGDEDDVVGYQAEEYVDMITKRATNQSAFRNRCDRYGLRNLGRGWGLECGGAVSEQAEVPVTVPWRIWKSLCTFYMPINTNQHSSTFGNYLPTYDSRGKCNL